MANPFQEMAGQVAPVMPKRPTNLVGNFPCQEEGCNRVIHEAFIDRTAHQLWFKPECGHVNWLQDFYA